MQSRVTMAASCCSDQPDGFERGVLNVLGTTTSNVQVLSGGTENVLSGGVISGVFHTGTVDHGTLNI